MNHNNMNGFNKRLGGVFDSAFSFWDGAKSFLKTPRKYSGENDLMVMFMRLMTVVCVLTAIVALVMFIYTF